MVKFLRREVVPLKWRGGQISPALGWSIKVGLKGSLCSFFPIMATNDWYDLFQLIYVQPGEKYWTKDTYWIKLIKKAGMQHYLYEEHLL